MADRSAAGASVMAGTALHFVTQPQIWPLFLAWLREFPENGLETVPAPLIRAAVARAHDVLAPDCDEPIEAL